MNRRAQLSLGPVAAPSGRRPVARDDLAWWREARFGLFVHWGLFAVPAGVWRGRPTPDAAEVLMLVKKIPIASYARLATKFHPRHWDAAALVRLAKEAGMKYLVITAKHHDGFAMYRSAASRFNVVDATPWGRDPMADLAAECRRRGLRLCFYYSQDLDWEHPDGAWNDWDFPKDRKRPERYLHEKVLPQVKELLTQYGPVGLLWFDMPMTFSREQGARIRRLVKRLQPHCLVCGRIGHDLGDYRVLRDNFLPPGRLRGAWEACATLNHSWGFKHHDHDWKSATNLVTTLVDLASKGANYLLNVGPDADGVVPRPSVSRLRTVGAWLRANGEAIYETGASPFPHEFSWGRITTKGRALYLHFFRRPARRFRLHGLQSRVVAVHALAEPGRALDFRQKWTAHPRTPVLEIDFDRVRLTKPVTVFKVKLVARPEVETLTLQQPDRAVTLVGSAARVGSSVARPQLRIGGNSLTENWRNTRDWLEWRFTVLQPGMFDVRVVTTHQRREPWSGGHTLRVECAGQVRRRRLRRDALLPGLRATYYPQVASNFGQLTLSEAGTYRLRLRADRLQLRQKCRTLFADGGIQFCAVRLEPTA